ncbi:cob(I)yrinic acid a,c-diamide adenosyltransferase [Mycoplasmoides pirum]|uniref:cob(I)yrinic acid a,c-diamide adenosyltransferase n=1 Tax=Mycoplasmoides pirum TaxID=2122 RepID=UPI00047F87BE|nr:cob(I)yrinic acid a,c-diamide adenosyltransferase [Mycoplasmoides pirum]
MVYAYYGIGQGKTSTLNGLCLRAIASKKPILYIRFFKNIKSSEDDILNKLNVKVHLFQTTKSFIWTKNLKEREKIINDAKNAINFLNKNYSKYKYIFLDEFIDLISNKIVTINFFCNFLKKISKNKYVFISGHTMHKKIAAICDVLTKTEAEKHHYSKGVQAKKFIDF